MKYDPSVMPLLNRGMILVFVHIKGLDPEGSEKKIKWKERLRMVDDLIDVTKYLKENAQAHPQKVFVQGTGAAGGIVASAINKEPALFQGALLANAELDPEATISNGRSRTGLDGKVLDALTAYSPYGNIKAQEYPKMVFFLDSNSTASSESVKMVARLRALKKDQNILLLKSGLRLGKQVGSGKSNKLVFDTYQYALLFQWIDDVDASGKRKRP